MACLGGTTRHGYEALPWVHARRVVGCHRGHLHPGRNRLAGGFQNQDIRSADGVRVQPPAGRAGLHAILSRSRSKLAALSRSEYSVPGELLQPQRYHSRAGPIRTYWASRRFPVEKRTKDSMITHRRASVTRVDAGSGNVNYQVAIPWEDIEPDKPKAGKTLSFSLVLDDRNSPDENKKQIHWFSGISPSKDPS